MNELRWLLYGAYGLTGSLIVSEALRRGHRPELAGRNPEALNRMADQHALRSIVFDLSDESIIDMALNKVDVLVNAAGPYGRTAEPLIRACIRTGKHYLDLSGELTVMEQTFQMNDEAAAASIIVLPGCGFDVVASDLLTAHLAREIPNGQHLELAVSTTSNISSGTAKAAMEVLSKGGFVRRDGKLVPTELGTAGPNIRFHHGERKTIVTPRAELESSWRTTGIPNITAYLALPPGVGFVPFMTAGIGRLMKIGPLKRLVQAGINLVLDEKEHSAKGSASMWGKITGEEGKSVEGWLLTPDPYINTAQIVITALENLRNVTRRGVLTPTQAFGLKFEKLLPGVRFDQRLQI